MDSDRYYVIGSIVNRIVKFDREQLERLARITKNISIEQGEK